MKYINYLIERFDRTERPVLTLRELRTALGTKGITKAYLKRLVNLLLSSGRLRRITKGVYSLSDDTMVVGFAFSPFYYGLESALTIRKLWEQNTNPIVLTTRSVRTGLRIYAGGNYIVRKIEKEFFFGYEYLRYRDFWIPVSDLEKTFIDMVHFGIYIRPDVLKKFKSTMDQKRLRRYLKNCDQYTKSKIKEIVK